jgi:hypothetical protein
VGRNTVVALRRCVLAVCAIAATAGAHAGIDTETRRAEDASWLPSVGQARLASLGFGPVLGDFYWLEAMHLVGSVRGNVEPHAPVIASLIELVTGLDPWVDHPYRFAAIWLSDAEGTIDRANALLEKGIAYHPLDWRNRHYLGFNHFYHLDDAQRAADVLEPAVGLAGAPGYLAPLVAKLRADAGSLDAAEALLVGLVNTTADEYAKARYLKSLDEIATERRARSLDAARLEYWKRTGHDLARVEDLLAGPAPVLRTLPPPHPHFADFRWILDPETGHITSSFYGSRYRLYHHKTDAARLERQRKQANEAAKRRG